MSTALNASLIKALEILDLFSEEQPEITAGMVAQRLAMSPATAHRFLLTLEHTGLLVSPRRGRFTLGQRLEELGKLAFEISPLPSLARPVVETVSRALDESVMACRLGRFGPVCIASANSRRPIRFSVDIGAELPMTTTAQGKLFLAHMPCDDRLAMVRREAATRGFDPVAACGVLEQGLKTVRTQGFATNFGENESEIAAVAMPVFDQDQRVILTLSVFGILSRFDPELVARCRTHLTEGAADLAARLATRGRDRLTRQA